MPRRRNLTDEEHALWQRVARTARRLRPSPDPEADTRLGPVPDPEAAPPRARPSGTRPPTTVPSNLPPRPEPAVRVSRAESPAEALARVPVAMDHKTHARMMRGKLAPEARIDLHGMTLAQAHPALTGFILNASARGLRLVLVITGKGRSLPDDDAAPMPRRAGALKHEVPLWLRSAPLRAVVLEIREAHRSHGGTGAYYVYLRRRR